MQGWERGRVMRCCKSRRCPGAGGVALLGKFQRTERVQEYEGLQGKEKGQR